VQEHIITLKVNTTTSNLFLEEPHFWNDQISTLLNVSSTRISLLPENFGNYHFVNVRIADYLENLIFLSQEKLVFALCISLFVLATIQLGMMFIGMFILILYFQYFSLVRNFSLFLFRPPDCYCGVLSN
jgi:hypothetical protein